MQRLIYHNIERKYFLLIKEEEGGVLHCRDVDDSNSHTTFYSTADIVHISANITQNQPKISEKSALHQDNNHVQIINKSYKNQISKHGFTIISHDYKGEMRDLLEQIETKINIILSRTENKKTIFKTLDKYKKVCLCAERGDLFTLEKMNFSLKNTIPKQKLMNKNRNSYINKERLKKRIKKILKITAIIILIISILVGGLYIYFSFFYKHTPPASVDVEVNNYSYSDAQLDSAINLLPGPIYDWRRGELKRKINLQKLHIEKLDSINKTF